MGRLSLITFGPPEVRHAGQVVKMPTRKTVALLIYLCVEGGLHSREKLQALLWPDSDETKGRGSLRLNLFYLRNALRDGGLPPEAPLLRNIQNSLCIDPAADWEMDLHSLQAAVQALRETNGTPTAGQRSLLKKGLDSYRSDFLEGFSLNDAPEFEYWISLQRQVWQRRASLLYEHLSQAQFEAGELVDAVETTNRWVAHDPLNESAYRRLIQIHLATGERTSAHRAFEACREILAREINAEPAPETLALADRIQHFTGPEIVVPGIFLPAQLAERHWLSAPLVGRSQEHLHLVSLYRAVRRGQCQAVVIAGEAGIGKTRLAGEFSRWAAAQGADIWQGRAFEAGGRLPYQPVVQMLRHRLERENAPDDLLADLWLAELSQLLPELRERYPDLPLPLVGNADFMGTRLFEAVARLGIALAAHRPLVLFVDDIHWADAGTRDMLHYLAQRWAEEETPALLLLTARQDGTVNVPELTDWLMGLERDARLTRLSLSPLTRADLHELVRAVADPAETDAAIEQRLGDWLLAETQGSPFFIAEMLQMLQEQKVLVGEYQGENRFVVDAPATWQRIAATTRLPLPPNVRGVILSRLARLSQQAQMLLLAAAVIGRRCSFELLHQVARLDELDGLSALEEALNSRLLLEDADRSRPFTFAHDNIRQAIYTESSVTRRRLYHRQALALLEAENTPPSELAFHAASAFLPETACRYAVAAGNGAMAVHAFADAIAQYSSALEIAEQIEFSSADRCSLSTRYGRALELSGRYADALEHYAAMAERAERTGDRRLALAALVAHCTIRTTASELSDFDRAEGLARQALALAQEVGDQEAEVKIQWNLLNGYRHTQRNAQALVAGERSLALARQLNLREETAYAANDLVYVYIVTGDIARALELVQMATRLWREMGNLPMLTDSLTSYAHLLAMTGDLQPALDMAEEALQIGRSLENHWAASNSLIIRGLVYWRQFAVDPALAAMDESIRLGEMSGFVGAQVVMRGIQSLIYLRLGNAEQARSTAQTACQIASRSIPLVYPTAASALASIELSSGRDAEACALLKTIPEASRLDMFNHLLFEAALCQHHLQKGEYSQVLELCSAVLTFLEERNLQMFTPDFLYFQGRSLAGLQQFAQAQNRLERAVSLLRAMECRWNLWESAALLADLAERQGEASRASEWRAVAKESVQAIAAEISDPALRGSFLEKFAD